MMRNKYWIGLFLFTFSCEKDEIPVPPHAAGDATVNTVEIGSDYKNQVFFSLESNEIISQNEKTTWDLAFESADTGWHVRLNPSKGMAAAKSFGLFESVADTVGCIWNWDAHSGNNDSTSIGTWQTHTGFYIIDRGYNSAGAHQGFSKIKLTSVSATEYEFVFADLASTSGTAQTISKNTASTYTYLSLSSGLAVAVAPAAQTWDLMFTQYTHIFDGPTPYLVTGVLLNPHHTQACMIDDVDFESVDFELAESLAYSADWNVIGYNWKYFDFGAGVYLVDPSLNFIIHTQLGYYYKFHFLDFYNDSGVKGYPKFEFQKL